MVCFGRTWQPSFYAPLQFYGGLLHDVHAEVRCGEGRCLQPAYSSAFQSVGGADIQRVYVLVLGFCGLQKAAALRRAKDMEVERDAALAEVLTWQRQHKELDQQLQVLSQG